MTESSCFVGIDIGAGCEKGFEDGSHSFVWRSFENGFEPP